jgi:gamma-glutamyltranspeptidase
MDDFSIPGKPNEFHIPPSPSNYIAARKRPMSSMSPLIVTDNAGDVILVTGASGGSHIISSVAYVSFNRLF